VSSALTPQQALPAPPRPEPGGNQLELQEIQGDVLLGLQKFFERFIFFEIKDVAAFKKALRQRIVKRITITKEVLLREFQLRDHKTQGRHDRLPIAGLNLGFTSAGLKQLIPNVDLKDPSFAAGAKARAVNLNDPVDAQGKLTTWIPQFLADGIHGVFLIAGGTEDAVNQEATVVLGILGASVAVSFDQTGKTRPGAAKGHEHFGWLDGVSQPGINGLTTPFPGQEMLDPGLFVFGYPGGPQPNLPWMKNGSFMVFRRLKQLVPEFNQLLLDQAKGPHRCRRRGQPGRLGQQRDPRRGDRRHSDDTGRRQPQQSNGGGPTGRWLWVRANPVDVVQRGAWSGRPDRGPTSADALNCVANVATDARGRSERTGPSQVLPTADHAARKERVMRCRWERPTFEAVSVNGECTAYSGSNAQEEPAMNHTAPTERRVDLVPRVDGPPADKAVILGGPDAN
jgi:deferrochelatase/peroxidase EfeB